MKPKNRTSHFLESFILSLQITRRNWTVYKKDFIANISPTIADPAFIMVSLGFGLGAYMGKIEGMTYMQYLAPGLSVATALFTSFFESSYGFYVRMSFENVFKAMLTTPIGAFEIILGELIWVGVKGAIMAFGVGVVLALFGLMTNLWLLPLLFILGFLVSVPCGAIGLISTGLVRNMNQFQTVYSFVIAPLYFLSGIFFPAEQMNMYLRILIEAFPLIHGVKLAQAIFWDINLGHAFMTYGSILIIQCIVYGIIGYKLIKKKLIS
jgi:lipooligosaccharide transport system permease protein